MARTSLPPGFRFHPTDVELILYYLKRKVMGKKLHLEAIAEVNIYKFSPWDLPDKSCLRNKDLEWFFFCPREKKYASGDRVKRATENGYWKATGKDRIISHNNKTIGKTKTLVFHLGHAPKGERTDWVLHEYTILDNQLAASGLQDTYMLCKVFKKNGLGPRVGAHYGAPFNEDEWSEDDVDDAQNHSVSLASDALPITQMQTEELCCPPVTCLFGPEKKTCGSSLIEDQSTSSGHPTSEVAADKTDDEIVRLLAQFTDDDMMLFPESSFNQDDPSGKGKKSIPCSNGYDIYSGLGDLDSWSRMNEERLDFWRMQNHQNFLENQLLLNSSSFIELDDLVTPLNCPENVQSSNGEAFRLHENGQQSVFGANSAVMNHYAANASQLHVLPVGTFGENSFSNLPQMVNSSLYQDGFNALNELDFALGQQNSGVNFAQDIERGAHSKICFARSNPARSPTAAELIALSFCSCGGSSIHIKAEVTHGAGECTNEALSVMMGGSSSCWCTTLPWAVFQGMTLLCFRLVSLVGFCFGVLVFCCFCESRCVLLSLTLLIQKKVQSLSFLSAFLVFGHVVGHFFKKLFRCFPVEISRKINCLLIERSFWGEVWFSKEKCIDTQKYPISLTYESIENVVPRQKNPISLTCLPFGVEFFW